MKNINSLGQGCPAKPEGSICLLVKWADTAFCLCMAEGLTWLKVLISLQLKQPMHLFIIQSAHIMFYLCKFLKVRLVGLFFPPEILITVYTDSFCIFMKQYPFLRFSLVLLFSSCVTFSPQDIILHCIRFTRMPVKLSSCGFVMHVNSSVATSSWKFGNATHFF